MIIKKDDNNKILICDSKNDYILINQDGQVQLKEVHKFLLDNISNKDEVIKNINFDKSINKELESGIRVFISNILNAGVLEDEIEKTVKNN